MLDLGFIHALRKIKELAPKERQTLFFSATMPKAIKELVSGFCNNPVQVSVTPQSTTAERIDQYLFMVQQDEKLSLLEMILERPPRCARHDRTRADLHTYQARSADRVVKRPVTCRDRKRRDPWQQVAAAAPARARRVPQGPRADPDRNEMWPRGIDIPGVSHVINYELPNVPEQYVHRIGRTARAGKEGIAIGFCAEDERAYLNGYCCKVTGAELERLPLPDNFRAVVEGEGPTKPAPHADEARQPAPARPAQASG